MKTYSTKPTDIKREWFLVDASGRRLGRLASRIAHILMGKHKPYYTRHLDTGDFVVVVNASKIFMEEKKRKQKLYYRHSGYPGGLKVTTAAEMLKKKPEEVIRLAVKGMLPKNRLGRKMLKKLKIYADSFHPHDAQRPKPLEV